MVDLFGNACKLFQKYHVSFISYMIMMATISNMRGDGGDSFIYYINVHNNFLSCILLVLVKTRRRQHKKKIPPRL